MQELELIQMLIAEDQPHLFASWPPPGEGRAVVCACIWGTHVAAAAASTVQWLSIAE